MFKFMKERISSNRGDSNTISQLFWIVLVVVIVMAVGALIYNAVTKKAKSVEKCINDSNDIFSGKSKCKF